MASVLAQNRVYFLQDPSGSGAEVLQITDGRGDNVKSSGSFWHYIPRVLPSFNGGT